MNFSLLRVSANAMHEVRLAEVVGWCTLAMGAMVFAYTPLLSWRLAANNRLPLVGWALAIFGLALLAIAFAWLLPRIRLATALGRTFARGSDRQWLVGVLATGILVRVIWIALVPAAPASDDAVYISLAGKLAAGLPYESAGTRAYWPPGYPLLLSLPLRAGIPVVTAVTALNFIFYALTSYATFAIGRQLLGTSAARLAIGLLAIWPGFVAYAGLPGKELLLHATLAMCVLLWLGTSGRGWQAGAAGVALGISCLTQPSLMMFPAALVLIDLLRSVQLKRAMIRVALLVIGMAAVVAPWSVRNYAVLGAFVPVSTTGGDNFYRANNPLATGGYVARGEVDLDGLGELAANREGYRLGTEWIAANPSKFIALVWEKQIRFLGDDSQGLYATLRRGGLQLPDEIYTAAKFLANVFWLVVWLAICVAVARVLVRRRVDEGGPPLESLAVLSLPMLYLFAIHSLFESASKYHFPALPFLALLAAGLIGATRVRAA